MHGDRHLREYAEMLARETWAVRNRKRRLFNVQELPYFDDLPECEQDAEKEAAADLLRRGLYSP